MDKYILLQHLPPFTNKSVLIEKNQSVHDIVKEVLEAHQVFAPDYDLIANDFYAESNIYTARRLFNFLKQNVHYKIESENAQTTKSPAAILTTGEGDCKHYAGFIAGVLDSLTRQGLKIDWTYRFSSYNLFDSEPGHVFVVLKEYGKEYWIDPVLKNFNEKLEPYYILDKKPKIMLQRLSGLGVIDSDIPYETLNTDDLGGGAAIDDGTTYNQTPMYVSDPIPQVSVVPNPCGDTPCGTVQNNLVPTVTTTTAIPATTVNNFDLVTWLKSNPLLAAGAGLAIWFLFFNKQNNQK